MSLFKKPKSKQKWLTVKETQTLLGYKTVGSIYRLILLGKLTRHEDLKGKIYLNRNDVLELLEPREIK